ncbi:MAG: YbaN family protein [Alistipes sp.]|nr:YbaN family protein [Alistipes sp.]
MNIFLIIVGCVSLVLGVAGMFLPLLPTTPFLLLSAAVWVKASPRLYSWLLNHKVFGEYIRNFREHRAIPLRVKVVSVSLVWFTIGYCIFAVVDKWWWAQVLMALLAIAISWHILSFATLKKEERRGDSDTV